MAEGVNGAIKRLNLEDLGFSGAGRKSDAPCKDFGYVPFAVENGNDLDRQGI